MILSMHKGLLAANSSAAWATWNPADKGAHINLSSGNLQATNDGTLAYTIVRSTVPITAKAYFELLIYNLGALGVVCGAGIASASESLSLYTGQTTKSLGIYSENGVVYSNASIIYTTGAMVDPKRIGVAYDPATRKAWFIRVADGTWIGGGDPATGTSPTATISGTDAVYAAATPLTGNRYVILVSDPANITGSIPAGFAAGI